MKECRIQENKGACNCSYPCEKKGFCCECVAYHRKRDELPACFFPDEVERTYDRSRKNFIRIYRGET